MYVCLSVQSFEKMNTTGLANLCQMKFCQMKFRTQMSSKFQWPTNGNEIVRKTLNLPTFTERLVNINQDTKLSVDNLCNKVQDILIETAKLSLKCTKPCAKHCRKDYNQKWFNSDLKIIK